MRRNDIWWIEADAESTISCRRRHLFGGRERAGMPVLPRDPDTDMCARMARGAEHELLHGPPGVFVACKRSRSQAVDRYRNLVYDQSKEMIMPKKQVERRPITTAR